VSARNNEQQHHGRRFRLDELRLGKGATLLDMPIGCLLLGRMPAN